MKTGRLILLALMCFSLVFCSPVSAQDNETGKLITKMIELFKLKKYREAIAVTKKIYRLDPQAKYLANIGRCYDLLRDDANALHYYQQFLRQEKSPDRRTTILERVAVIRQRYSLVRRELNIISQPSGADLYLDGKLYSAQTPTVVWLPFGKHLIELKKSGYKSLRRTLQLNQGSTLTLDLKLEPKASTGILNLTANVDGARIFVGGKLVGATPLIGKALKSGSYECRIQARGHRPWVGTIQIDAGKTRTLKVTLEPLKSSTARKPWSPAKERRIRIAAWSTLGAGILIGGLGFVPYALAIPKARKTSTLNDARALRNWYALPLWIIGGATLITSATLWIVWATRPKSKLKTSLRFQIVPVFGSGHVGVLGRFDF